jgi:hypothetical protein
MSTDIKVDNDTYQISTREGIIKVGVKDSKPFLSKEGIAKLCLIYDSHELDLPEGAYLMKTDFGLFLLFEVGEKITPQKPIGPFGPTGGTFMPVRRRRTHSVTCEYLMTKV